MRPDKVLGLLKEAVDPGCTMRRRSAIRTELMEAASQGGCDVLVSVFIRELELRDPRLLASEAAVIMLLIACSDRDTPRSVVHSNIDRTLVTQFLEEIMSPATA